MISIGFDLDEALEPELWRTGTGMICVCGHPRVSHTGWHRTAAEGGRTAGAKHDALLKEGVKICQPGSHMCPCAEFKHVLNSPNGRFFKSATTGTGARHALGKGMAAVKKAGKAEELEWTEDAKCANCGTQEDLLAIGFAGNPPRISSMPSPNNILVCTTCKNLAQEA